MEDRSDRGWNNKAAELIITAFHGHKKRINLADVDQYNPTSRLASPEALSAAASANLRERHNGYLIRGFTAV